MIDVHAHAVLPGVEGAAGDAGPEIDDGDELAGRLPCYRVGDYRLEGVRYRGTPFMDFDVRVAEMDRLGIDLQVVSPNPLTFFHHIPAVDAVEFCRKHNDELATAVSAHEGRLLGFAQLPMQDPGAASEALRRAIGLGLVGAYIGTDVGQPLDADALDPIWSICTELDVPLFLHPAPGGIDRPRRDERLARFDGDLWLGFAYEEALAVSALVLGGVVDRHPDLDICISHGGGATAWLAERMEYAARTRPWGPDRLRAEGAVTERLRRLWWDTHVGGPRALASLRAAFGDERLVAGTNLAGWDETADPAEDDADLAAICDANARQLLRLAG